MELKDAIQLIDGLGNKKQPETWADLGCGSGLFTHALAHLLPSASVIYAVDKSPAPLDSLPNPQQITIQKIQLDFVKEPLGIRALDGILMANALHFVQDKISFLTRLRQSIQPGGSLLFVEYDTDRSNPWVPYPIGFKNLKTLLGNMAAVRITKLGERPSLYQKGNMYAVLVTIN